MNLTLSTLLQTVYPAFDGRRTKLHLAQWNGHEQPLDVFEAGDFDLWQNSQTARNFERDMIAALIATPAPDVWMFAGLWSVDGPPTDGPCPYSLKLGRANAAVKIYRTTPIDAVRDLIGRLHIRYRKTARASYRLYETVADDLVVSSLMDTPRGVTRFRSYREVRVAFPMLKRLVSEQPEDWRTALSSVSGVYLITTRDGQQYVGSASGADGFWGRWTSYIQTEGHGDNAALRALCSGDPTAAEGFHFAILETADSNASREDILARESHWKRLLGTRATGLNLN